MEHRQAIAMLAALAQESRLAAFRLLVQAGSGGLPAGEIGRSLGVLQNTMSGHLGSLAEAGLIAGRRSGREIHYRIESPAVRALIEFLTRDCCAGRPDLCGSPGPSEGSPFAKAWAAGRRFNVLFLCTANSTRSIMAEAILRHDHGSRFRAFSAGSAPSGAITPETATLLERLGYPVADLASKGWAEFSRLGAPNMDFVFTLCDEAANEVCPAWPGDPLTAHWGVPDPNAVRGGPADRMRAFANAFRMIERRIGIFAGLPFADLDRNALQHRLHAIGAAPPVPA